MNIEEAKELVEKLQKLSEDFKKDVPEDYIEMIDTIWTNLQDDIEYEEKVSLRQEEENNYQESPSYGYDYEAYIREVR